jgi:hypothetical protein
MEEVKCPARENLNQEDSSREQREEVRGAFLSRNPGDRQTSPATCIHYFTEKIGSVRTLIYSVTTLGSSALMARLTTNELASTVPNLALNQVSTSKDSTHSLYE